MLEYPRPMTPLGIQMLADIPPFMQDDPVTQAVIHVYSKESERILGKILDILMYAFPAQTDSVGLTLWEIATGVTIHPPSYTLEERRAVVLASLHRASMDASVTSFLDFLATLVGSGFTYQEHYPYNPTGDVPPEYTIQISLPYPSDSDFFNRAERFVRILAPSHIDLVVTSQSGFGLDFGRLDEDALG